jgi:hypothetical protein
VSQGEFVEYIALPNIPPPQAWNPPNIAADAWRALDLIKSEFEDLTHIYASVEGGAGAAESLASRRTSSRKRRIPFTRPTFGSTKWRLKRRH